MDQYYEHFLTRKRSNSPHLLRLRVVTNLRPEEIQRNAYEKVFFFVHGLGGRIEQFQHQVHHLTQSLYPNGQCLCICFDWLGHGKSDKPIDAQFFSAASSSSSSSNGNRDGSEDEHGDDDNTDIDVDVWSMYSWEHLIDDAMFIYQHYTNRMDNNNNNGDKKPSVESREHVIIGHSMGSALAMLLTMKLLEEQQRRRKQEPETTAIPVPDKLILIGTSDRLPRSSSTLALYLPVTVLEWLRPLGRNGFRKACFHENTSQELILSEEAVSSKNPMFVIKAIVKQATWPTRQMVEDSGLSDIPTLIFTGEADKLMLVSDSEELHSWFNRSSHHVLKNAGHLPMLETPEETNRLIQQFLQSQQEEEHSL